MTEPILLSLGKTVLSPVFKLVGWVFKKWKRPSLSLTRAPSNILEHIKPGVPIERVREELGAPHRKADRQYCYLFSDLCVQIDTEDDVCVDAITVALRRMDWRSKFIIYPLQIVLGKTTFLEILDAETKIEFDKSSKHYHFWVTCYFGFPGLYLNYAFGALEAPGIIWQGEHWSPESQLRSEISKKLKFNWVCVYRLQEIPSFNYYGFV